MSALATLLALSLQAAPGAAERAQEAPAKETPVEFYLKDGLKFRTGDGSFEGWIGGRFIFHGRTVIDRPDDGAPAPLRSVPDSFFIRQVRLETGGTFQKDWGYKAQADFGTGQYNQSTATGPSNVTGTLRDAYLEWKRYREFIVRAGTFYQPCSQEDMSSTRFIDFAERSVMNRLMSGRVIGIQARGHLLDDAVRYYAAVDHGGALLSDGERAVVDANDEKELAALLYARPAGWCGLGGTPLEDLRIGFGLTVTDVDTTATDAFDLVSTELSIMYLDSTGVTFDGRRIRKDLNLSWNDGPFSLRLEVLAREDELLPGTSPEEELDFSGWYLYGSWIVTGEKKTPEDRIVPEGSWGAVEILFRAAHLEAENFFDAFPAQSAGNSDQITSYTLGTNWWVTRTVRITLNAILERYDDPVAFPSRPDDSLWGLLVRFQVDF
jgi:phosphate-selective porin OprO/OprP